MCRIDENWDFFHFHISIDKIKKKFSKISNRYSKMPARNENLRIDRDHIEIL